MLRESQYYCPDCDDGLDRQQPSRREFIKSVGTTGAALLAAGGVSGGLAAETPQKKREPKPAEGLIRELYTTLSPDQKKELVYPWEHGAASGGKPSRLKTHNRAAFNKRLADNYNPAQRDLVKKILRAILSSDEALERVSRYNKWDASRSFEGCGSIFFGEPSDDKKFAWVFSGHHLTFRCDGNSEPGAAFGGPVYYGHLVGGYNERNVYFYQTKQVQKVFDSLSDKQQQQAIAEKNPGDRERGIQFPPKGSPKPGIAYSELSGDQQGLVETVMRTLLDPFRKEDADEVLSVIKSNGGMQKIHLAFYKDSRSNEEQVRWHFWRLEGPGFIWNYRVLPHVHCYVNITSNV